MRAAARMGFALIAVRSVAAGMMAVGILAAGSVAARAGERDDKGGGDKFDSEHMFGFTTGSDIGEPRGTEVENETEGRIGKRFGSYAAFASTFEYKYTLNESLRISPGVSFAYHDIAGVPGFDDRRGLAFQGFSTEISYRFLDRQKAPFGVTLNVVPQWNAIDDGTGARVDQYGAEMSLLIDRELVAGRLYGALNLIYDPAATRTRATGVWEREADVGLGTALTARIGAGVFLGVEARYLRKYDTLSLDRLEGQALFAGPTFYVKLSDRWSLAGAWNMQVAGHEAGESGGLDLVNFDRHQFKLRISADLE